MFYIKVILILIKSKSQDPFKEEKIFMSGEWKQHLYSNKSKLYYKH
jgi:hypothetical protein